MFPNKDRLSAFDTLNCATVNTQRTYGDKVKTFASVCPFWATSVVTCKRAGLRCRNSYIVKVYGNVKWRYIREYKGKGQIQSLK